MSSAVIDVVLGLIFVFFLFSMLCSGINEFIARTLGKRADFLVAGLWSLLDNSTGQRGLTERARYLDLFHAHPLVRQLGESERDAQAVGGIAKAARAVCGWVRWRLTGRPLKDTLRALPVDPRIYDGDRLRPSYIPASTFASVVMSFLRTEDDLPNLPSHAVPGDPAAEIEKANERRANGSPVEKALQTIVDNAEDGGEDLRTSLEHWYDAQMERVSGWYKRESKRVLIMLAVIVVLVLNVDTLSIARSLWNDPVARRTLADAAQQQIQGGTATTPTSTGQAPTVQLANCTRPTAGNGGTGTSTTTTSTAPAPAGSAKAVARALDCARSLPIPIGWRIPRDCTAPKDDGSCPRVRRWVFHATNAFWHAGLGAWFLKLLGWGLTAGALTFGAPFWFDLLNRFGSLRGAGSKPKSSVDPAS